MENGNDTIYKCYDDLVHKLVGGKSYADILTSSPILKKKKKSDLNSTVRGSDIKTFTMGGLRIKSEGDRKYKMVDLIKNVQGEELNIYRIWTLLNLVN